VQERFMAEGNHMFRDGSEEEEEEEEEEVPWFMQGAADSETESEEEEDVAEDEVECASPPPLDIVNCLSPTEEGSLAAAVGEARLED
jgi:hypothetical protein